MTKFLSEFKDYEDTVDVSGYRVLADSRVEYFKVHKPIEDAEHLRMYYAIVMYAASGLLSTLSGVLGVNHVSPSDFRSIFQEEYVPMYKFTDAIKILRYLYPRGDKYDEMMKTIDLISAKLEGYEVDETELSSRVFDLYTNCCAGAGYIVREGVQDELKVSFFLSLEFVVNTVLGVAGCRIGNRSKFFWDTRKRSL